MDTYHRILQAALASFCARGYDAVGVHEIAVAAGVTKPPLYHHFGSKQGLLEALLAYHYEPWLDELKSLTGYRGDLPLTIYNVARGFFDFADASPTFYRLQLSLWFAAPDSVPHQAVASYLLRQHRLLEGLFQSATHDHGNLRGHHGLYAITLSGMINGYISSLWSVGIEINDSHVHTVVRQFMYGIFAL